MQLDMRAKKAIIYDVDSMATIYGKKISMQMQQIGSNYMLQNRINLITPM
jgi:hypothetical protein